MNEKPFAFVLMPFAQKYNDIYKLGIKEAAKQTGFHAERVDEQIYTENMLDRIYNQIDASDVIIADMSERNPNVFYELGYADAKNKTCILLTSESKDIPFDLLHRRHIIYNNSITRLKEALSENLLWVRDEIRRNQASNISLTFNEAYGTLETTKYNARGSAEITIDLHNNTETTSPEIEAIYAHTTKEWTLYQDGKRCPSTTSEKNSNFKKHRLKPPCSRLQPEQWDQLNFETKKFFAHLHKGDVIKDEYNVKGTIVFVVTTTKGNFDYEITLDVKFSEFPF